MKLGANNVPGRENKKCKGPEAEKKSLISEQGQRDWSAVGKEERGRASVSRGA